MSPLDNGMFQRNNFESMDARFFKHIRALALLILFMTGTNYADSIHETANFTVHAPCAESAQHFAETAEQLRKDLAILWLGDPLPNWSQTCRVVINVGTHLGAGGFTTFIFENGEVFDWYMEIQGTHERILDSVLPHEIMHMILASHFRQPIPRWLDEGMATYVEHNSEKSNHRRMLRHYLQSGVQRCFPLNRIVAMKEYPDDPMPFYVQSFSLVEYLIERGRLLDFGEKQSEYRRLVDFIQSAMPLGDWQSALQEHYGIDSLGTLQLDWVDWVGDSLSGLPMAAQLPNVSSPDTSVSYTALNTAESSGMVLTGGHIPPPVNSVYTRQVAASPVQPIPTHWNDDRAIPIPVSFGR